MQEVTGLDAVQATEVFWKTDQPRHMIRLPFGAIGVVTIIALVILARLAQLARCWNDMNV